MLSVATSVMGQVRKEATRPALAAATPATRPNIIVMLADDMGFSDLGCYGSEIQTPNLDRLAAGGMRFSQFYNAARCSPTRAALLTGLYPNMADMANVADTGRDVDGYRNELSHEAVTISEVLRTAGYATYMAGKWHLTLKKKPEASQENWPRHRGFDRFWGTIPGAGSYFDPATLVDDDKRVTLASVTTDQPFYYTDAIATHAISFLRDHHTTAGDRPFFLYVAFTSPHWPLHAPAETIANYKGKYDGGYEPIRAARYARQQQLGLIDPHWQLAPQAWRWDAQRNKAWEARCMETYAAQIDQMDQNVGRIVDALRETGQLENTVILFLSDNGACAEDVGRVAHEERRNAAATQPRPIDQIQTDVYAHFTPDGRPVRDGHIVMPGGDDGYIAYGEGWANVSNTPFRTYKHFVHEGGIATPLIAYWPAGIAPTAAWQSQPGHVVDLMPTCVELASAAYPTHFDGHAIKPTRGVSLVPTFHGKTFERTEPIFFDHEANRAVRDGKWKLVARGEHGAWELYDMDADRTELHDLAATEAKRVRTMADQWQRWAETTSVLPRP